MDIKPKKRRGRPPKQPSSVAAGAKKAKHRRRPCSDAERYRKLQEAKEETREQFNKVKARVLSVTPPHLKDMYHQVCFARFGKAWWLVLVLEPYDVPPGSVRNQWTEQFERCRKSDALDDLNHVVYWYGAREECSFYGFVAHKDLVTYQQGIDMGYFKAYEVVKQKSTENKKLTKGDHDKLLAINEVDEDLAKQPEERKRGVANFPEVWELLSYEDIDDLETSSSEDDDHSVGAVEKDFEVCDGDDEEDDEPEPQRYARKKSYHDSTSRSNVGKFVHRGPVRPSNIVMKSSAAKREQSLTERNCQTHREPSPPSMVSSQSLDHVSTTDERLRVVAGSGYVFASGESALHHLRAEARRLLEQEKALVLSKLTDKHKNRIGSMGFYKEHTVLVVSPYSVPPGKLRSLWMKTFAEMEQNDRVEHVPFLVYQYDARRMSDNPGHLDHCYSLVPPSELASYEDGEKLGLGQIPPEIQRRFLLEGEDALTAEDKHLMHILREKEVDAGKEPSQRSRGYQDFPEVYDLLTLSAGANG